MTRSIQQLPNNTGSTSIVEIPTQTGFNAGDLVYYQNGDYKGAPNMSLPTTANFSAVQNQPAYPNATVYSFNQPGAGVGVIGGSSNKCSAVLTNGNIVQVFMGYSNGYPYFQIVNSSNVIQVSATSVSTTYINTSYANIGVNALTGGGFVVYWSNTAGGTAASMNYAVYTNTGAVTTAATQDTSFALSGSYVPINAVALANGGFVLASVNATPAIIFRGYGATGTGAYSTVTISPAEVGAYWFGLSTRSDSSIVFLYASTSTQYTYALYNSSGSSITSSNFSVTGSSSVSDVTTLSDGTTYVFAYSNYLSSKYTPCFRLLPTGNTLGSEKTIPAANINLGKASSGASSYSVLGLSSGNFIYVFPDGSNYPSLAYAVFNSSGTPVIASNANGVIPLPLYGITPGTYGYPFILETTTSINIHWNTNGRTGSGCIAQHYLQLSKTSYIPISTNSNSFTVGSTTGSTSGLSYQNTTPSALSAAASTTTNLSVQTSTSYTVSPALLYNSTISNVASTTLPNGQFLIAYKDSSYNIYVAVFSNSGSFLQTITVATGYASNYTGNISISSLPSGKFVITYYDSSNNITNALYSSSYALIANSTLSSVASSGTSTSCSVAGLTNDRFVVAYTNSSSQVVFAVYDNTNTQISAPTLVRASSSNAQVCANEWGGFFIGLSVSSANYYVYGFYNTSGNSYASFGVTGAQTVSGFLPTTCSYFGGTFYSMIYSSPNNYVYFTNDSLNNYTVSTAISASVGLNGYQSGAVGVTGLGSPVMFYPSATSPAYSIAGWGNSVPANWSTAGITYPNNSWFSTSGASFQTTGGNGPLTSVTSWIGNNVVIAWVDTNNYLYYAIVNAIPTNASIPVTAGVTGSNGISVVPTNNTVSSTAIGAVLTGVAATTASAGSTGQVVINGPAQLNSNYINTATGAFDYTGQPIGGVKGVYNGKLLNLQGNS